jgi:hypothetical protein
VDTVTWATYGQDLEDNPPWPAPAAFGGVRVRPTGGCTTAFDGSGQWNVPALEIDLAESALAEIEDGKPRRECPGPGAPC